MEILFIRHNIVMMIEWISLTTLGAEVPQAEIVKQTKWSWRGHRSVWHQQKNTFYSQYQGQVQHYPQSSTVLAKSAIDGARWYHGNVYHNHGYHIGYDPQWSKGSALLHLVKSNKQHSGSHWKRIIHNGLTDLICSSFSRETINTFCTESKVYWIPQFIL